MSYKKVLITGASRGLGKELAYVFANNDYNLILHSKKTHLPEIKRSFRFDRVCENVPYDRVYGDLEDRVIVEKVINASKDIDVFVNNAGIYFNNPISEMSVEKCLEVLGLNLISPILLIKGIFEIFKEKKAGMIININSTAGKCGSAGESVYSASKFGMSGFLKSIQFEATKYNIQVIDVYLGAMKTEMAQGRKDMEKMMRPYEVAKCIYSACLSDDVVACETIRITELHINRRIY